MKKLSALLMGGAAMALSSQAHAETPPDAMVMAWNIDAISTFDPAQIGEVVTDEIIMNICDGLLFHDTDDESKVVPGLAESWEVAEDGSVIILKLREGATFPSGNPVTAEDAVWSMKRVLELGFGNSASMTQWGFTLDNMDEAFQALDDHTIQVTMQQPFPPDLIMVAVLANRVSNVLDKETVLANEKDGDLGNGFLTANTACVGPYQLRQWNAGEVVVLERNDTYWGPPPPMKRIFIRHVPEAAAQRLQIEQGDIDVARDLTPEDIAELQSNPDVDVLQIRRHQMTYWGFNNAHPILGDDKVRVALKYLIDYEALGETVMKNIGIPRNSFVPLGAFGALDEEEGLPFSLDLDKARELLAEAGHPDGFDLKLFIGSAPESAPLAQHIQENASKVGLNIEIEQMANAELFSRFRGRDFDSVLIAWSTGIPHAHGMASRHAVNPDNSEDAKLTMYPTWRASWFREDFNALVDQAVFERDSEKQLELYREMQLRHLQEGPFAYMFQQMRSVAVRNEVQAYPTHAFRTFYNMVEK